MKIAIIGAGRNKNGIGHYIGKFFQKNGARVTAVLGTTPESARQAAQALYIQGTCPTAYTDCPSLLNNEPVDAVVIASPDATHPEYLYACIEAGVHIFCEKPLLHPGLQNLPNVLENILTAIEKKRLILAMNAQWTFALPDYEKLCGRISPEAVETFCINLSPLPDGRDMIPDSVPHALSLMVHVLGKGHVADLAFTTADGMMGLTGTYHARMTDCRFQINLTRHTRQPRPFSFGWNDRIVDRRLTLDPYEIAFQYQDDLISITDPLELSVRHFLSTVGSRESSPVGPAHIRETTLMLKQIYDRWEPEVNEKR